MRQLDRDSASLILELFLLGVTAPIFLFASSFPNWVIALAMFVLVSGWIWRKLRLGYFITPTPINLPLFLLFVILLPMSIWAAPSVLRTALSLPRALVLVWSVFLFWTAITYSSRRYSHFLWLTIFFILGGVALAVVSLLGTQWLVKFGATEHVLSLLPSPLIGRFSGAESGFHPNQVAGTLLYVLPLLIMLAASSINRRNRWIYPNSKWLVGLVWGATLIVGATVLLTQSRSALLGLTVGLLFMALVGQKWGRYALIILALMVILWMPFASAQTLAFISDASQLQALGGSQSVETFRVHLWTQALRAVSDFPLTGTGLGTFREVARVLYPLEIPTSFDFGHAHNFFLQVALDFGLLGLIVVVAIYISAIVQLIGLWRIGTEVRAHAANRNAENSEDAMYYVYIIDGRLTAICEAPWHIWAVGFGGCFVAQTVFSMLDAVAMGAKTSFMFWYLLALVMGLANLAAVEKGHRSSAAKTTQ